MVTSTTLESNKSHPDYERKLQTSETLLKLAMIRLMVRRLAKSPA